MDLRRKIAVAAFLVATGVAAGVVFQRTILRGAAHVAPLTAEQWQEQVRLDAVSLLGLLRPGVDVTADLSGQAAFWAAWDERRARYTAERLADLRGRLHDYLDFLQAEYADCSEIYVTGRRPESPSDAALEGRKRVRSGFGAFAEKTLLPQVEALREEAYRASPQIAGYDPALPDWREEYSNLKTWLPGAHRRADELTAPPAR